jgi:transposase
MEQWVTIRTLKKRNSKLGTRQIAELLGVSRNTVKRALRSENEPEYVRAETVNPEIEPFREFIFEELFVKKLRGSRVLKDIQSKGYQGSKSAFYRYLSTLEAPVKRTFHPYETAMGEQAQFDWSEYTVLLGDVLTKVYVFIFLLGFSRYRIYQASLSQTQASVFEAMETSMWLIGGVSERIQTDNARCFITDANPKHLVWNSRYLAFSAHWGFHVSRSLVRHPWSKGKVENPFDYLEDHFIDGNSFRSFEEFQERLSAFQAEVNDRVHDTTRQKPSVLFEQERSALRVLPEGRYVGLTEQVRKATTDCLIPFDGSRYSVPDLFALREVWLRVLKGYLLEISSTKGAVIAIHRLSSVKGKVVIDERHYRNHRVERGSWERLSCMFLERFPHQQQFLDRLKAQKRLNPAYHLTRVMDLAAFYEPAHLEAAFGACQEYNIYNAGFVKGYLEHHASPIEFAGEDATQDTPQASPSIKRPLQEYSALINQLSLPLNK